MNQDLKQYAQLHDENIELKKEIERLKGEREWISVKDRLPDNVDDVFALSTQGLIYKGFFLKFQNMVIFHSVSNTISNHITHWMPIPKKPKQ